ncbi:Y-family DNA polymerase [Mycoplasma feriruminatoris]|uniref:Y-family DNA polymerase n=1 Tax=Mycoplasma feriruminatoris TaxID=1179777 RepID=UPI00241D35B5|nr:DNA polymerase IV [Mycoplasma feriruminatoris]WFQ94295.1 DNA polymerase IV [Mycoplasma feriruminatoris]WFQ95940.1 DNA polymerase IV [Mycoplasma feriruminatoris]
MFNKTIIHIDMDAFFASCMQLKHPELKNKPVVISNNFDKSIISTASYEARKYNIKAAMPLFKAKKLYPQIISIKPDMNFISNISHQIWEFIKNNYTNKIEIASIDEAYLDVSDLVTNIDVLQLAKNIQQDIYKQFNLTCSLGIGFNRFSAKMSTSLNKPNGITLTTTNNFKENIWPILINKMYGVGESAAKLLINNKIKTIKDLALLSDAEVYGLLNKKGLGLKNEALGLGSDYINYLSNEYKSISKETTLNTPIYQYDEIETIISSLSKFISYKLHKNQLLCKTVEIKIRYKIDDQIFDKQKHLASRHKQITLKNHTNDFEKIYNSALDCFYSLYEQNKGILLIGVGVCKLIHKNQNWVQLDINDEIKVDKNQIDNALKIENMIFNINKKFKKPVILKAKDLKKSS